MMNKIRLSGGGFEVDDLSYAQVQRIGDKLVVLNDALSKEISTIQGVAKQSEKLIRNIEDSKEKLEKRIKNYLGEMGKHVDGLDDLQKWEKEQGEISVWLDEGLELVDELSLLLNKAIERLWESELYMHKYIEILLETVEEEEED